jgi:hypothetical protein
MTGNSPAGPENAVHLPQTVSLRQIHVFQATAACAATVMVDGSGAKTNSG